MVLFLSFELLQHDLQAIERLLSLLVLSLFKGSFCLDALQLLLDDLHVVLSSALIVLQLSFLGLLAGLRKLELPDIFLQVGDGFGLCCILFLEHFLGLPMRIRQELVNLPQKRQTIRTPPTLVRLHLCFQHP